MRVAKEFEEFLREGIVKTQAPDRSRANFLVEECKKSHLFLMKLVREFGINDENADSIIRLCYDIILELVRAKMLERGFNASGQGAHEAEVSFLRKIGFSENDIVFANQLRYFRNSIVYYGKILDKEYAEKVFSFTEKTYPLLGGL